MSIILSKVGSATSATASGIPAFDPASKRLYVVAGFTVNVYTVSNTGALAPATDLAVGFTIPAGTTPAPNSVSVKNGIVAVAYEIKASTTPFTHQRGQVSFYRASDGAFLSSVEVGFCQTYSLSRQTARRF